MTNQRDLFLQEVQGIRTDMVRTLDGMDYCLDWKPDDDEWSAREIVYHLVDTPSGGIDKVMQGTLDGSIGEVSLLGGLANLTPDRQGEDLDHVRADLEAVLSGMERALSSVTDAHLTENSTVFNLIDKGTKEECTMQAVVEGMVFHWRGHLTQLSALRYGLGLD